LEPPTGSRLHFTLTHAGNENGFVLNAKLKPLCKKNTADAHDEQDCDCYELMNRIVTAMSS
jgi:hypothetical protein